MRSIARLAPVLLVALTAGCLDDDQPKKPGPTPPVEAPEAPADEDERPIPEWQKTPTEREDLWPAFDAVEAGDYEEAIAHLEAALAKDPEDHVARAELGEIRRHYERDSGEAKRAFERVVAAGDAAPAYARALALRGLGYEAEVRGDIEKAKKLYERSLEALELPWTHRSLSALAVVADNDYAAAERHTRRALQLDPDDQVARVQLAAYLARRGAKDEARGLIAPLEEGPACHGGPPGEDGNRDCLDYNLACVRSNLGDVDAAIATLKRYLEGHARSPAFRAEMSERAKKDPDFDGIRDDPRFAELVGGLQK